MIQTAKRSPEEIIDTNTIVSDGTLKTEDLLRKTLPYVEALEPYGFPNILRDYEELIQEHGTVDLEGEALESAQWLLEEVFSALNSAVSGFTFGATEDDGACFAFQRVIEERVEGQWLEDEKRFSSFDLSTGYPVFYITDNEALCPKCASDNFSEVEDSEVNWEDPELYCGDCSQRLMSCYAEDEAQTDPAACYLPRREA